MAAFWVCVVGVLTLSLTPLDALPPQVFDIWDKAQHTFAFAVLTGLGTIANPDRRVRLILGLLALGGLIEILQGWTGWRYAEWADWLADGVGLALGLAMEVALGARARASRPQKP